MRDNAREITMAARLLSRSLPGAATLPGSVRDDGANGEVASPFRLSRRADPQQPAPPTSSRRVPPQTPFTEPLDSTASDVLENTGLR